jgi:hypothetical protein
MIRRLSVVALIAVLVSLVAGLVANAGQTETIPPVPDCFTQGTGYGSCSGIEIPTGAAVTKMLVENKKSDFYLIGPAPLDSTKAVACGDEGCVYHHLNWVLGAGASAQRGCGVNQSFCDVKVAPGSGWVPVYVRQDNDTAILYAIWNTGKKGDGVITGYITDKQKNGVAGVAVDAYGEGDARGQSGQAVSGDRGYYSMEVKAGTYKVIPSGGIGGKQKPKFVPEDAERTVAVDGKAQADFQSQTGLDIAITLSSTSVAADGYTVVTGEVTATQLGKPAPNVRFLLSPKPGDTTEQATSSGARANVCDSNSGARIWPQGTQSQPAAASVTEATDTQGQYHFSIVVGTVPGTFEIRATAVDSTGKPLDDPNDTSDEATLTLTETGDLVPGQFLSHLKTVRSTEQASKALAQLTNDPNVIALVFSNLSVKGGQFGGLAYSVLNASAAGPMVLVYQATSPPRVSDSGQVTASADSIVIQPAEFSGASLPSFIEGTTVADFLRTGRLNSAPTFPEWVSGKPAPTTAGWSLKPNKASLLTPSFVYNGWPYPPIAGTAGACS